MQVIQRQSRGFLHKKKIIANAPLCDLVCKATAYKQHTNNNIKLAVEKVFYVLEQ